MKKDITELYIVTDDFCKECEKYFNSQILPKNKQPTRTPCLQISEIMTIILLFHQSVVTDDFCKEYEKYFNSQILPKNKQPTRAPCLQTSEIMTIILLFHQSPAKNFKSFYTSYLQLYTSEFPNIPSYNRFVELQQRCLGHFHALLMVLCALALHTGLSYIDSTLIPVYHNKRIGRGRDYHHKQPPRTDPYVRLPQCCKQIRNYSDYIEKSYK